MAKKPSYGSPYPNPTVKFNTPSLIIYNDIKCEICDPAPKGAATYPNIYLPTGCHFKEIIHELDFLMMVWDEVHIKSGKISFYENDILVAKAISTGYKETKDALTLHPIGTWLKDLYVTRFFSGRSDETVYLPALNARLTKFGENKYKHPNLTAHGIFIL